MVGALSGTAVATTVGKGIVEASSVTQITVVSALASAIVWDIITWYFGLPTSSSHAILSSIVGAAIATAGTGVIIQKGVYKVLIALIVSPILGVILGFLLMLFLLWLFRRAAPSLVSNLFGQTPDRLCSLHGLQPRQQRRPENHGYHHHGPGELLQTSRLPCSDVGQSSSAPQPWPSAQQQEDGGS